MKIERLLSVVFLLLNKDRIQAKDLAERFNVSIRTIYRDIETINNAGIPVVSYQGNNGGFGIIENFKMDKQFLKLRDFLSILTGLREINKPLGDQEIENVIEKINNLIPPHRKDQIQEYQDQLIIDFLPWGFAPKQEKRIKEIQKAIRNNMTLKIGYRNMKNELTERVVEPMTLVFRGYNWYLFAYCCKKGDYRLFKVNRIKNIKLLFHIFKRRKKSFQDVFAQNDQREKICLKLKYSPDFRYKVEEYFGEKDIQLDDQGNLIVIMSLPEDDWIYSYILGFGDKVEVLEPESIRDIIKDKISKMNRIYP